MTLIKRFWPYGTLIGVPALGALIISGVMKNSVGIAVEWLWPYLLLAFVMSQLSVVLFSLKFSEILALYDSKMGLLQSCKISLVSTFYYFALPAAVGVELSRYLKLRSAQPRLSKWQAMMILLLDRAFGLAGAVLLLGAGIWFKLDDINLTNALTYDSNSIIIAFIATILLLAFLVISLKNKERLSEILQMMWRRKLKMFILLSISTSYHFLLVISVWFALIGLGIEISMIDLILAICGGMVFMIVPLSLAGISLAELGAAAILISMGTEYKIAELVAFLFYLTKVIPALQGALVEFLDNSQIVTNRFKK